MTNIVGSANQAAVSVFSVLTAIANTTTNTVSSGTKLIDGLMTNAEVYHSKQLATVKPRIALATTEALSNVALSHAEKMNNIHTRASANPAITKIFEETVKAMAEMNKTSE